MSQFNEIIKLLDTDSQFGITVHNLTNVKPILVNKSKEDIISSYGSIDTFFNGLFLDGITEIGIQPKRKNGKSRNGSTQNWEDHPHYPYVKINLNPTEVQSSLQKPKKTKKRYLDYDQNQGLAGSMDMQELVRLHVDRETKQQLLTRNNFLEERVKVLEAENLEFKFKKEREVGEMSREEREDKRAAEKAERNNKTLETIMPLALPILEKIASSIIPSPVAPMVEAGLAQPNLPETNKVMIKMLSEMSELNAGVFLAVNNGLATSEEFAVKLNDLLMQYSLLNAS